MKKHLLSLFFVLALLVPAGLMAQSGEVAKGKHGGYLTSNDQKIYFEIVDDGTNISFYPCDKDGNALSTAPSEVDVTVAFLSSTEMYTMKGVQINEGAYTVSPQRIYPVYLYGLNYTYNNEKGAMKFRKPDSAKPR